LKLEEEKLDTNK